MLVLNESRVWNALVLVVDSDPTLAPGLDAGINSIAITNTGLIYKKTGTATTAWTLLVIPSGGGVLGNYGAFYSTATQTNLNPVNLFSFNNIQVANGVTIVGGTQITVSQPGVYNIQFSAQVGKGTGTTEVTEIWFLKNGNPIPWTNTGLELKGAAQYVVAAWNFVEAANAGDNFEIAWYTPDATVQMAAVLPTLGPPARPGIPSIIVTVIQETSL